MVRRLSIVLAFGLSGCLLYTDPINDPPSVRVTVLFPAKEAHRNEAATAVADVHDAQDGDSRLNVTWTRFAATGEDDDCAWVNASAWQDNPKIEAGDKDKPHALTFTTTSLDPLCLCARVLDTRGAAGYGCAAVRPVNREPTAVLQDLAGVPAGEARPLYSLVHLSADKSLDPDDDPMQFDWQLQFTGTDPAGEQVQLVRCDGVAEAEAERHRCFQAQVPGTYRVTLKVGDSLGDWSEPTILDVPVKQDTPPCLQLTDPDLRARRIMLSRANDLGGSYESRAFVVRNVADDGEPYPQPNDARPAARFWWFVKDLTAATPKWQQRVESSPSLTISQADFPRALPGDTVQLRVEVRDTGVQQAYENHAYDKLNHDGWPCSLDDEICCEDDDCNCVRWTTWTVQFQP